MTYVSYQRDRCQRKRYNRKCTTLRHWFIIANNRLVKYLTGFLYYYLVFSFCIEREISANCLFALHNVYFLPSLQSFK